MVSIIAAIGKNRELGKNNQLLWKIPGDLPRFKKLTWGHPVIMGRKTHSTFQYKGGPLPGRTNIVVTHDPNFIAEGFIIVHSLDEAFTKAKESEGNEEIFIIGGGSIYQQALPVTDRLYLTIVQKSEPSADTFFPEYSDFTNVIEHSSQETEGIKFSYITRERGK